MNMTFNFSPVPEAAAPRSHAPGAATEVGVIAVRDIVIVPVDGALPEAAE